MTTDIQQRIPTLEYGRELYRNNLDVVISRYRNTLSWINLIKPHTTHFKRVRFFVYNKGDDNYDFMEIKRVFPNSEVIIIPLKNVGKCDHTYLYHIVNNYDSLSDIIYFLPDTSSTKNKINDLFTFLQVAEKYDCHFGKTTSTINERNLLSKPITNVRSYNEWFLYNMNEDFPKIDKQSKSIRESFIEDGKNTIIQSRIE